MGDSTGAPQGAGKMFEPQMRRLIAAVAGRHGLGSDLVYALVIAESGGNPSAIRFEPGWRYHKDFEIRGVSEATEQMQQATSWGLLQVMGTVARELGCRAPFLSELCRPEVGLWYGCRKLAQLWNRYDGAVDSVIAAYNAGSARRTEDGRFRNQEYVDKVLSLMPQATLTVASATESPRDDEA